MICSEFEKRLEELLANRLEADQAEACQRHMAGCTKCTELVELAALSAAPVGPNAEVPPVVSGGGVDLTAAVLARTSGSSCTRAESLLCGFLDGETESLDRELISLHLESCAGCRHLAGAVETLIQDLPRLAEVRPRPTLVPAVLAATLPVHVRVRRWWVGTWPRWVRRPRFAFEVAYLATLILVVFVALPGSPLQAMSQQALELTRTNPVSALEDPLADRLEALKGSDGARVLTETWQSAAQVAEQAPGLVESSTKRMRTFWESVASLFQNAGEESVDETNEETP